LIKITVTESYCYINPFSIKRKVYQKLVAAFSVPYKNVDFIRRKYPDFPDRYNFIDTYKFGTGLLMYVCKKLEKMKQPYILINEIKKSKLKFTEPHLKTKILREDQLNVIRIMQKKERGICSLATAFGKTLTFAGFISTLPKTAKVLYLIHRDNLFRQTRRVWEKELNEPIGSLRNRDFKLERINLCTIQTFVSKRYAKFFKVLLQNVDVILFDEVHWFNTSCFRLLMKTNCRYRFGFSGTVKRNEMNYRKLIAWAGPVLKVISIEDQIVNGKAPIPQIYVHKTYCDKPELIDLRMGYDYYIKNNKERDKKLFKILKNRRVPCLIFVERIHHCRELFLKLLKVFPKVPIRFISYESSKLFKNLVYKEVINNEVEIVVCTTIWDEGVDLPQVQHLIDLSMTESYIRCMQRLGRGMRLSGNTNNKQETVRIDIFLEQRDEYLRKKDYIKYKYYKKLIKNLKKRGVKDCFLKIIK